MRWILAAFLIVISTSSRANDYTVHGLTGQYSPYYSAIVNLNFDGRTVTGTFRPLQGDSTPEIAVSGVNYAKGKMRLQVPLEEGLETLEFEKEVFNDSISWESHRDSSESHGDRSIVITRPRNGSIPSAQTVLSIPFGCGAPYGIMTVALNKPHSSNVISDILGVDLSEGIKESHGYYGGNFETPDTLNNIFDVEVPLGSEAHIARTLRRDKRVHYADLADGGGCGGTEVGYLAIDSSLLSRGPEVDPMKFAELIEAQISNYVRFFHPMSIVETVELKRSLLDPYPPQLKLRIVAPSIATRSHGSSWDHFYMIFTTSRAIPSVPDNMTGVLLWAERLYTGTRKVSASSPPPRPEYIDTALSYFDEASVAYMIARQLAWSLEGKCDFFIHGFAQSDNDFDKLDQLPDGCNGL